MNENDVAKVIVDAAVKIHQSLGPGLLESVLAGELRKRGLNVERQVQVRIKFDDIVFEEAFRADMIVQDLVIVEVKSVEKVASVHKKQVLTYLRLTNKRLGLLLNFGDELMKDGVSRVANGMPD